MDGTVPKIFYNFYLNFMNFLIFFKFQGAGLKISNFLRGGQTFGQGGPGPLAPPPPAATPLLCPLLKNETSPCQTVSFPSYPELLCMLWIYIQNVRSLARLFFELEAKPLLRTLLGKFEVNH